MEQAPSSTRLGRISGTYSTAAVIALNTIVTFVVVNLAASIALWWLGPVHASNQRYPRAWLIESYGLDTLARAYPGMTRADVESFLFETSNWFQEYEAFTGFRPAERHDRFITIDRDGFRPVPNQAAWPPDRRAFNVFLFGGSTMMGAGVPDNQTIAAAMQHRLSSCSRPVHIYNFGRGFYFSTQERILFEQLILAGFVPDAAIFFDGLNDFYFADGVPQFASEFTDFMTRSERPEQAESMGPALGRLLRLLPLTRLLTRTGLVPATDPIAAAQASAAPSPRSDDERITSVIDRWSRNRAIIESIAERNHVRLALVWQPVPTYGYDRTKLNVYRDGVDLFGAHRLSGLGYPRAAESYGHEGPATNLLWLADMQRNRPENLYVDAVHYSGSFSSEIAARIASFATSHEVIPCGS